MIDKVSDTHAHSSLSHLSKPLYQRQLEARPTAVRVRLILARTQLMAMEKARMYKGWFGLTLFVAAVKQCVAIPTHGLDMALDTLIFSDRQSAVAHQLSGQQGSMLNFTMVMAELTEYTERRHSPMCSFHPPRTHASVTPRSCPVNSNHHLRCCLACIKYM